MTTGFFEARSLGCYQATLLACNQPVAEAGYQVWAIGCDRAWLSVGRKEILIA